MEKKRSPQMKTMTKMKMNKKRERKRNWQRRSGRKLLRW